MPPWRTSPTDAPIAGRSAQGDRPHRRGDAPAADGARRDHRPADRGQEEPGDRLGVPAGARGRDDAPAGQRHKGILPLDTAESIWRVIIATFTYVQAPFSVHADLSAGDALMRDSARFHFGFTVPFVPHMGAAGVVAGGVGIEGRSRPGAGVRRRRRPAPGGARSNSTPRRRSSRACRSSSAPTIRPRCRCSWCRASPPTPW